MNLQVGVQTFDLLSQGATFFNQPSLVRGSAIILLFYSFFFWKKLTLQSIYKYHRRKVERVSGLFVPLQADNEILISRSRHILTLQGHPEMTADIVRGLLETDTGFYKEKPAPNSNITMKGIEAPHDGSLVWNVIMAWALQPSGAHDIR